ncbi:MAG: hypothetical protein KAS32_21620, partial [Candidatus Peribacteraceae bacterium]|nr:hypothetical protein [Candidatus Peribacteraceae bacterium]
MDRMIKRLLILILLLATSVNASWMTENDTTTHGNNWSHIKTCAILYDIYGNSSRQAIIPYIAERHDLVINPTGEAPITADLSHSAIDSLRKYNSDIRILKYALLTSLRTGEDMDTVVQWASDYGYDSDSIFMHVVSDSIYMISAQGSCAGDTMKLGIGDSLQMCTFSSWRYTPDMRQLDAQQYFIWKAIHWYSDYYEDPTEADIDGVMEDEAHYMMGGYIPLFPFRSASGDLWSHWEQGDWNDIKGYESSGTWEQTLEIAKDIILDTATGLGWSKLMYDSAYANDVMVLKNITEYADWFGTRDHWRGVKFAGGGILYPEIRNGPIQYSNLNNPTWEWMDSIIVWDTGYAVIWNTIFDT